MQLALQTANRECRFCRINGVSKIAGGAFFQLLVLFFNPHSPAQWGWLLVWSAGLLAFALKLQPALKGYFLRSALMFVFLLLPLPFRSFVENDDLVMQVVGISVYHSGLLRFFGIFLKTFLLLNVSLVLIVSMPLMELLYSFQKMKLPDWILSILMYVFRLIYLMEEEGQRMKRAMRARSGKISFKRRLQILIQFSVVYLARLMDRSERTYLAMVSRGFQGKMVLARESATRKSDWLLLLVPLVFAMGVFL